jgi:hypothetical protein
MTALDRITLIILKNDGGRDKVPMSSWVGVPRKGELLWIGEEAYVVVEVEYAIRDGFFGGKSAEAAGVYARRLSPEEEAAVARRLSAPTRGSDEQPFRP